MDEFVQQDAARVRVVDEVLVVRQINEFVGVGKPAIDLAGLPVAGLARQFGLRDDADFRRLKVNADGAGH